MIEIPPKLLPEGTLVAVIEEYILREGTDYGSQEVSLENKISQVRRQLNGGDIVITFDPVTENCTLLTRRQFNRYQQEHLVATEGQG
ncbi:MAG: YheU family protein [Porticoccaceae bacterium]|nr:YheU family protein [Porticoccaceae bacterium]MBT3797597.1 YheU family protein [Porticoccaceae bacterium]MBT4164817.1 YheU family protein [Porticoccaceae bacterium]MBT4211508.1 YheU family protein [Porticoccaceae bacterium]MBT4590744.1 YheU family protein [Porticoccaceae bacterium]